MVDQICFSEVQFVVVYWTSIAYSWFKDIEPLLFLNFYLLGVNLMEPRP